MAKDRKVSSWAVNKGLAREILNHRGDRRRLMARVLMGVLGFMVGGLWVLDGWLMASVWRFLIWWGGCAVFTCLLLLLALYDLLAVIREERGRISKTDDSQKED
ncbi:MAG: hypothetical protein K9N23_21305 [Akkermansiaceae bacterium]|nr:hypothetical protein [Akkermansiaceae bacterium]